MISVVELLSPGCIKLDLKEARKSRVILELVELLEAAAVVSDKDALAQKILEREALGSTGIGHGVAIPHCLTSAVDRTMMAFGRSATGIHFDKDNRQTRLIFLLAGPPTAAAEHLQLLSRLSRLLSNETFRNGLLDVATAAEVLELFGGAEEL